MTAIDELLRLKYLAAMGVPVYLTRRALPGAAVSRKLYRVESAVAPVESRASAVPPGASRPSVSQVPQSLRESLRDSKVSRTQAVAEPAQRPNPTRVERPQQRFRLAAVVCANRLWVEELGDDALALDQLRLINAMGQALTHPVALVAEPRASQFDWPMHDNQQLGLGVEEASASIQGFLLRQIEEASIIELVCLGEEVATRLRELALPCARRCVRSTRQVLQDPALKPGVWAELTI